MKKFEGFKPETIDFLWELRMNNSKEWMEQNRDRYKEVLKDPFDAFAAELEELSPMFCGEKAKFSVSRINRDIRYSKDKSPYRPNRWVVLYDEKYRGTEWKEHPSFYFELMPEGYSHGLGMWCAKPAFPAHLFLIAALTGLPFTHSDIFSNAKYIVSKCIFDVNTNIRADSIPARKKRPAHFERVFCGRVKTLPYN